MNDQPQTPPRLAIVVPCYNEQEVLPQTHEVLLGLLGDLANQEKISSESLLCYVDDGSADETWELISDIAAQEPQVRGIKFSRNFGHQNALIAGMLRLRDQVDCVITIDADLQDDVACIAQMVDKYNEGHKIVYGVRESRTTDTFMKRWTAESFYRIMDSMGVETVYNHADFRLVDRQALDELARYGEVNMFLRGVFPQIGFNSAIVTYSRLERTAGETKYPFRKMLNFAWEGVTSFTGFPLRMIFFLGCLILALSLVLSVWAIIPVIQGRAIQGWASTVIPIFVFAGLQMSSVGILGEYLSKVYQEVKSRPRFIIETEVGSSVE